MTKLELDSYNHMSPQAVRRWLLGSCVAACAVATALIAIAAHDIGSRLNAGPAGPADTIEVSSAEQPR